MFRTAALMAVAGVVCVPAAYASNERVPERRMEQVRALAHEVQEQAEHVRAEAISIRRRPGAHENQALRRLDLLVVRARQFHREAERRRVSPARLDEDFRALQAAWRQASGTLRWIPTDRHMRQDFQRLSRAVDRLENGYERLMRAGNDRRDRWPHQGRR
jgi:hypothetical protein